MATNEILPFADAGGANVLAQAAYSADAQRSIGNQPGIARADFNNKVLRQAALMAAGLGQWLADKQATNVTDTLLPSQLSTMIENALKSYSGSSIGTSGYQRFPSGLIIQWGTRAMDSTASPHAVTFPIAFPTACLSVQAQNNSNAFPTLASVLTTTSVQLANGSAGSNAGTAMYFAIGY